MGSIFVNTSGKDFAEGVTLDENDVVVSVNASKYPSLEKVTRGAVVLSINGTPVTGNAKMEQMRYTNSSSEILVVLSSATRDEFDLSSGEDEEEFRPATALPSTEEVKGDDVSPKSADVVYDAAQKCGPGKCVVIMSDGANPALPIALAAERAKVEVMYVNTVARMKTRQKMDDAGGVFTKSLEKGLWMYVEQATKSITLLDKLSECIAAVEARKTMHPKTRVLLMCEPHPHFPTLLMKGCVTLRSRLQDGKSGKVTVKEDLIESKRKVDYIHGDMPLGENTMPEVTKTKKKVKISNEVNIVHLEKSTFLEMSASARLPVDRGGVVGEGLNRMAKYSFGSNEKFISLCKVPGNRYAVGTNSGYVVLLDSDGIPLIHFRPHHACIWDVAFGSQFDFTTACENGTSTIYNYSLAGHELTATSVASFQSDVFAVTYADENDPNSAVLSGGLSATVCVLHSDRQNSSFMASGTSIQAMCSTQKKHVLVGGGDGTCTLIDTTRCAFIDVNNHHPRKVPAVACHGDVAVTGGFDKITRLWDVRSGFHLICETPIAEVVTAVALNDRNVAVCCGSDLLVWDQRKMDTLLTSKRNAWRDLTRGLVMHDNRIVTASVDGVARFWEIH